MNYDFLDEHITSKGWSIEEAELGLSAYDEHWKDNRSADQGIASFKQPLSRVEVMCLESALVAPLGSLAPHYGYNPSALPDIEYTHRPIEQITDMANVTVNFIKNNPKKHYLELGLTLQFSKEGNISIIINSEGYRLPPLILTPHCETASDEQKTHQLALEYTDSPPSWIQAQVFIGGQRVIYSDFRKTDSHQE